MSRFLTVPILGISLLAAGAAWAAPAPNLIVNGGFETGDFTGWTVTGTPGEGDLGVDVACGGGAHSGNCYANIAGQGASMSQTIATTPGATYTLELWAWDNHYGTPSNGITVKWNGNIVSTTDGFTFQYWTAVNLPNLVATGTSTVVEIDYGANDGVMGPSADYFDDISVTANALIPTIVIKPGASQPATINMKSNGKTPVAILSTATWSAPANVDTSTLTFGETGTEQSYAGVCAAQDVDGDGIPDLVCNFTTQATNFQPADTSGTLDANTLGGIPLTGTGSVKIIN